MGGGGRDSRENGKLYMIDFPTAAILNYDKVTYKCQSGKTVFLFSGVLI